MKAALSNMINSLMNTLKSPLGAYQVFQVSRQAFVLLITIIMVKSGLSSDEVGQIELHFYIAGLLSLIWLRPLNQYMLYEDKYDLDSVFAEAFRLTIIFAFIFFGLYLCYHNRLDQILFGELLTNLIPYFLYFAGLSVLNLVVCWLYRKGRFYSIYSLTITHAIISLIPFLLLFYGASTDLTFCLLGFGGIIYLVISLISLNNATKKASNIPLKRIKEIAFPLALYGIISMLPAQFDSWLVQDHYSDKATFAVFRYGARELPLVITLLVSFSQAIVPKLKLNLDSGLALVKSKTRQYMLYLIPILILLALISRPLYLIFYSADYSRSVLLFDMMLLLVFSKFLFPQSVIQSNDDNQILYQVGVIELIINIIVSILLIQHFGLVGVVIGTIVAFYFEKVALICIVRYKYNVKLNQYLNISYWAIGLTIFAGILVAKYLI